MTAKLISTLAFELYPGATTGITTYINKTLRRGRKFKVNGIKDKRNKGSAAGLNIGRYNDLLFRRILNGEEKLVHGLFRHRRCVHLFAELEKLNITITKPQLRVTHPDIPLATELDGIGYCATDNKIVVLELKCTQYSVDCHLDKYKRCCVGIKQLTIGEDNSEYVAHQLQLGFGIECVRRATTHPVTGYVAVCCTDGTVLYPFAETYGRLEHFKQRIEKTTVRKVVESSGGVCQLPLEQTEFFLQAISKGRKKYTKLDKPVGKYGSFVALAQRAHRAMVVGIYYDNMGLGVDCPVYKRASKFIRKAAASYRRDRPGVQTAACLVLHTRGQHMVYPL